MKKTILFTVFLFVALLKIYSQEVELSPIELLEQKVETHTEVLTKLSSLKVTGYIQSQVQWGEQSAALRVGSNNVDALGNGIEAPFNRIGIRRGRLKFTYDDGGIASGVFQLNIIDKPGLSGATVQLKEAYLNIKFPFLKTGAFRAGVFDRPFGNEISYSSSLLESPERSRLVNVLFPEECDMGAMLVLQAPVSSPLNFIKFEGGLFAGNAINPETDNKKDFIGHIVASKPIGSSAKWGLGASYYNGGVYQTNSVVYKMNGKAFEKIDVATNTGAFAKREYFGVDGQFSFESPIGITQLRGEYILGVQPGNAKTSNSPNRAALPSTSTSKTDITTGKITATVTGEDTYIRPFSGFYGILVQDLGRTPFSAVVKYEVYDANSAINTNEVGVAGSFTNSTDLKYGVLGLGGLWRINNNIRLQAYYEFVSNETSSALANASVLKDYSKDLKDNTFTLRLQYKF